MQARSALFDLYGDHLRSRGGAAPVAALIRLLAALDIAGPAVRTAISRMVREGWLAPHRLESGPGYQLTPPAVHRLDDAANRIYHGATRDWDGRWHLLVLDPVPSRSARGRLRAALGFLGYAPLGGIGSGGGTWIAPRPSAEVDSLLAAENAHAERFVATDAGGTDDSAALMRRAWDVDGTADAYRRWLTDAQKLVADYPLDDDQAAYAARSRLVHEWRKFLFSDPGLPRQLLPDDWPGDGAAAFFDAEATRLAPAANRFVDHCLAESTSKGTHG